MLCACETWSLILKKHFSVIPYLCRRICKYRGRLSTREQKSKNGDVPFIDDASEVWDKLLAEIMTSVKSFLEELLELYPVLYYTGQMDANVSYVASVNMYNRLNFSAAGDYRNATRVPWYVDGELAGYMKSAGNFTQVLVRNAGHMVPMDQPKWAFDLITRFTSGNLLKSRNKSNV